MRYYGVQKKSSHDFASSLALEEFHHTGFTIIPDLISQDELIYARKELDSIYTQQVEEMGEDNLSLINELNLVRCPLSYNNFFLQIATKPRLFEILKFYMGDYFIVNQQNGIINRPNNEHYQSAWHRDLPYQDYVISKPIAIACLICIDDFKTETGSTYVIPFSHRMENIPSEAYLEKHELSVEAKAGSGIVFNAMLYHRAGYNSSKNVRRGLNTLFSIPLLKQQIDLKEQLGDGYTNDPNTLRLLGFDSAVPGSINKWRANRIERLKK